MRALITLAGLLACVAPAGCGLKGPLYLPTAEELRETAERERALEERERIERNGNTSPATQPPPASTQPPAQAAPPGAPAN